MREFPDRFVVCSEEVDTSRIRGVESESVWLIRTFGTPCASFEERLSTSRKDSSVGIEGSRFDESYTVSIGTLPVASESDMEFEES